MITTASPRISIEAVDDGAAEAVRPGVLHRPQLRHRGRERPAGSPRCRPCCRRRRRRSREAHREAAARDADAPTVEAMQPSSSRAGMTTREQLKRKRAVAEASSFTARQLQPVRDGSPHAAAISSRMASTRRRGVQPHSPARRRLSSTIHGISNGRWLGSPPPRMRAEALRAPGAELRSDMLSPRRRPIRSHTRRVPRRLAAASAIEQRQRDRADARQSRTW